MALNWFRSWFRREPPLWEGQLFQAKAIGKGRDIVLLHGLAASRACWEGAAERLGGGLRLHTPQMRGFAGAPPAPGRRTGQFLKPMADELAAYLRANARGPVAVVGHSMGGLVTLVLARDHPDVVDRVMVVDVPSFFSVLINPFATAANVSPFAEATRRRYLKQDPAALEMGLRRSVERLVTDPGQVDRIVDWGLASDQETIADIMAEVMVTDMRPHLPAIRAPVDVVYAWDRSAPATRIGLDQVYATAYAGLADCRRVRIDEARHYVMLDQPEIFYGAVQQWLAR
jgi:pimeloyl-ACP methyl ester carboxylesterase